MAKRKHYYEYLYDIKRDEDGHLVNDKGDKMGYEEAEQYTTNVVPPVVFGLDETPYDEIAPARYPDNKPVWVTQGKQVLKKVPMIVYVDVSDIGITHSQLYKEDTTNPMGEYIRGNIGYSGRWNRLVDRLVNTPMDALIPYMYTEDWQLRKHKLDKYEVDDKDVLLKNGVAPRQARIVPFIEEGHLLAEFPSEVIEEDTYDDEDDDDFFDN